MKKIFFINFLFLIAFFLIIVKLFTLTITNSQNFKKNYLLTKKINPARGKIFDRNGDLLANNELIYQLVINPKEIASQRRKDKYLQFLEKSLGIELASLEANFNEKLQWLPIKKISLEEKIKLEKNDKFNLIFDEENRRYYPEGSLSAHLIGFVGKNYQGEDVGYSGIEGYYNKDLLGLPGVFKTERNFLNFPIFSGNQQYISKKNGRDLYLTVDKAVQRIIKEKLIAGLEKYQAKSGCIIVAKPNNMEILGLVCLPDYNPNEYYLYDEVIFKNPVISEVYEPGSIFKPLIVAAALEENKIKPLDQINEDGPYRISNYQIKTWNNQYEGKISITRVLEKSSNVGMTKIGEKLGRKKIYQYLVKYGFNELTGIDLQGEIANTLKDFNQWYPIDFATVTFGQGIAVTPIQMISAFSSLINGGILYQPRVTKKIISNEKVFTLKPKIKQRVISKKTSEIIKLMLVSAVENGEVSWQKIKPSGYKIGGKTGTAQIPIAGHYDPNKTIASFIGFFPLSSPKIICLVILQEPKTSIWGSETAAPLFFEIAKELIIYYNIAPE